VIDMAIIYLLYLFVACMVYAVYFEATGKRFKQVALNTIYQMSLSLLWPIIPIISPRLKGRKYKFK